MSMKLANTSLPRSASTRNDKALVNRCTKIQGSCTTLHNELDDRLARHGIQTAEFNALSKRLERMDRTASMVLKMLR